MPEQRMRKAVRLCEIDLEEAFLCLYLPAREKHGSGGIPTFKAGRKRALVAG